MNPTEYEQVEVESYIPDNTSGLHGSIHIHPTHDQGSYKVYMHVSSAAHLKDLNVYPLGTRFLINAKITSRQGGKPYMYTNPEWEYEILD